MKSLGRWTLVVSTTLLGACGGSEQAADQPGWEEAAELQIDVAVLIRQLADSEPGEYGSVVRKLAEAGRVAVPALLEALESPDENVKQGALQALMRVGPEAAPAVPRLIQFVRDDEVRMFALPALASIGPAARAAAPLALEILQSDPSSTDRMQAAEVVAAVLSVEEAVPPLLAALDDEWGGVRGQAVWELKQLEVASDEAVAAYLRLLTDDDRRVRSRAASALAVAAP